MSHFFGPDEQVVMQGSCSIEQPLEGKGIMYLTTKRLILIHRSGMISRKETPLLDLPLRDISYVRVEGTVFKTLIVAARAMGGTLVAYKMHTQRTGAWAERISSVSSSPGATGLPMPPSSPPMPATLQAGSKYCVTCGQTLPPQAKFCSNCGKPQ